MDSVRNGPYTDAVRLNVCNFGSIIFSKICQALVVTYIPETDNEIVFF